MARGKVYRDRARRTRRARDTDRKQARKDKRIRQEFERTMGRGS